MGVFETTD